MWGILGRWGLLDSTGGSLCCVEEYLRRSTPCRSADPPRRARLLTPSSPSAGVVSAPLYDSTTQRFAGMFTLADVVHLIQYYYLTADKYENVVAEVEAFQLESLRSTFPFSTPTAQELIPVRRYRASYRRPSPSHHLCPPRPTALRRLRCSRPHARATTPARGPGRPDWERDDRERAHAVPSPQIHRHQRARSLAPVLELQLTIGGPPVPTRLCATGSIDWIPRHRLLRLLVRSRRHGFDLCEPLPNLSRHGSPARHSSSPSNNALPLA